MVGYWGYLVRSHTLEEDKTLRGGKSLRWEHTLAYILLVGQEEGRSPPTPASPNEVHHRATRLLRQVATNFTVLSHSE